MDDGYRPGRVVNEREDYVMLQCSNGHAFVVRLIRLACDEQEAMVKNCPFCSSHDLKEI